MAKIFQFPDLAFRQWQEIKPAIEHVLNEAHASPEMQEEVTAAMRGYVEKLSRKYDGIVDLRLPADLNANQVQEIERAVQAGTAQVATWLQGIVSEMLAEFLRLEVALYLASDHL